MKSIATLLSLSLLIQSPVIAQEVRDCSNTSEGLIPIDDLGQGYYLGQQGGLYPLGSNERPEDHEAAGIDLSLSIVPRGPDGRVDQAGGVIVMMSVGMSNAQQEYARFMEDASVLTELNPSLVFFDGAEGGMTIEQMTHSDAPYWEFLIKELAYSGLSPEQVQVVWLKESYDIPRSSDFSENIRLMADDLTLIVNNIKRYFPNTLLCYCTSRIYGGYTTNPFRNEPVSYESGFGFKLMIEDQIDGNPALNYDPELGIVKAPWLSWGPYMWADGLIPRSDGLIWECEDFEPDDGYHPAEGAEEKMSQAFIDFFSTDPTAVAWFRPPTPVEQSEPMP